MPITIDRIDHLVLTVANIETTVEFYRSVLGMKVESFGLGRTALVFGQQKFNLHEKGREFDPKAEFPTPGAIDICLVSTTPIPEIVDFLQKKNIELEEGPIQRTGANCKIFSVYFRDPDGNLIEVSNYI